MFDLVVDLLRTLLDGAADRLRRFLQVEMVTGPPGQTFGPDHDHAGTALDQSRGQRHCIGRFPEEIEPATFARFRRLVGQYADRFAAFERLQQTAHPGQVGSRQVQLGTRATSFDHGLQPGLPGWPVQDRDRRMRGQVLRGDLETAEMRRQIEDPLAAPGSGLDQFPARYLDDASGRFGERSQPDSRQFECALAGFADGPWAQPPGLVCTECEQHVLAHVPAVGRRQQPGQPAEESAERMQPGQRQAAEKTEQEDHACVRM
ncbi:MAG: hypothetical protein AW09_003272 [Candidatus Accumulibacter phosphatis]|uniref:Uncharacterized protein n=1 Tax=Candidatus Accumulibacter phosphatis TaxID=327160 RepID=A0A080LT64_9PROT|nr:MAG: hypothetical protein AW09_003272 [Candidatus Accumulibacter phosphatis]